MFLDPAAGVSAVEFYIDSLESSPNRIERRAPFDFGGTAPDGLAIGWSPWSIEPGEHTIFAKVFATDGAISLAQASFESVIDLPDGAGFVVSPGSVALNLGASESERVGLFVGLDQEADGTSIPFTVETSHDWIAVEPRAGSTSQLLEGRYLWPSLEPARSPP